jgi:MFS family permease
MSDKQTQDRASMPLLAHSVMVGAVAVNAAAAMIVEITAGRLLAPYFGMSLYTWTTVIGVVLAGLASGHWLGGYLADRYECALRRVLAIGFVLGAVTTVAILPITRMVALSLTAQQTPLAISIVSTALTAFLLPSLSAGIIQPLATTYVLHYGGSAKGRIVGRMLAAGAVGSILGTFLAGFVLISYIGSAGTIWLVAGLNLLLAALFFSGAVLNLIAIGFGGAAVWAAFAGSNPAHFETPCQVESQYYCIRIDSADRMTGRPSRLMALDHLVHSINDEKDPNLLSSPYVHLVDEIARRKFGAEAFSAFFVGGGGYTLPRAWEARGQGVRITVAEIDPVVTRLAKEKMWFAAGPGVTVADTDARAALIAAPTTERYDVVFGDAFHDIAVPAHLVTDAFHAQIAERLTARGFYVVNIVDDPQNPRLLASVIRTLRKRFRHVEIWGAPEDLGGARRGTFIVYASAAESGLPAKYTAANGHPRQWWRFGLRPERIARIGLVLTDDFAPVDRLLGRLWLYGD